jgi:hypothetical protein
MSAYFWLRRLALATESWFWSRWHMISAPPEHEGATVVWSPAAEWQQAEPSDWDDAAREDLADAEFWEQWNADMDRIEAYVRDRSQEIELLARAWLTGGHTEDNLPVVVALGTA